MACIAFIKSIPVLVYYVVLFLVYSVYSLTIVIFIIRSRADTHFIQRLVCFIANTISLYLILLLITPI